MIQISNYGVDKSYGLEIFNSRELQPIWQWLPIPGGFEISDVEMR